MLTMKHKIFYALKVLSLNGMDLLNLIVAGKFLAFLIYILTAWSKDANWAILNLLTNPVSKLGILVWVAQEVFVLIKHRTFNISKLAKWGNALFYLKHYHQLHGIIAMEHYQAWIWNKGYPYMLKISLLSVLISIVKKIVENYFNTESIYDRVNRVRYKHRIFHSILYEFLIIDQHSIFSDNPIVARKRPLNIDFQEF